MSNIQYNKKLAKRVGARSASPAFDEAQFGGELFEIYSKRSKAIAMEVIPSNIDDEENFNLGYLGSTEGTVNNGPDSASDGTQSDTDSVKSASSSHNGYENKNKTDKRRRYSSSGGKSGRHSRGSKSKKLESKKYYPNKNNVMRDYQ